LCALANSGEYPPGGRAAGIRYGFDMEFKTRRYQPSDFERLIEIIRTHLHDEVVAHIGPWEQSEAMLCEAIPSSAERIRVTEIAGEVVAFVWTQLADEYLLLEEIHVVAHARSRGLGRLLLEAVEEEARAENLAEVRLTVFKTSPAVAFYQQAGYEIVSETERNQFRMRKRLSVEDA